MFGREIVVINRDQDSVEVLAQAIVDLQDDGTEEDDEEPAGIGGGSYHDFERDVTPLRADEHHRWDWEDRFGFH